MSDFYEVIETLPHHPEEIAAFLEEKGYVGQPNVTPLQLWVKDQGGYDQPVGRFCRLPDHVAEFLRNLDAGWYPAIQGEWGKKAEGWNKSNWL